MRRYSFRQIPNCGKCHAALPEGQGKKRTRWLYRYLSWPAYLVLLASPLLFFWWIGSGPHEPVARNVVQCAAQPRPLQGDYQILDVAPRLAPFGVETQTGLDYLVKLENTQDWALSLTFFIHGGEPFDTNVPLGTYLVKYAAGKTWCGARQLFGNKAIQKGRTPLVFARDQNGYAGQTVTLYGIPHGNFATEIVPVEQF